MNITVETITPEKAKQYLEQNTNNYRKLSPSKVTQYANDMMAGQWEENGEPIQFAENGVLLNGQHRLAAIVKSGVTISMPVIRGISNDVSLFDIGKARTAKDIAIANNLRPGTANNTSLGVASLVLSKVLYQQKGTQPFTKMDIVNFAAKLDYELELAYRIVNSGISTAISRKSIIQAAVLFSIVNDKSPGYVLKEFFTVVNTGLPIKERECSPALVYRNVVLMTKQRKNNAELRQILFSSFCDAFHDFVFSVERRRQYPVKKNINELFAAECNKLLNAIGMNDK